MNTLKFSLSGFKSQTTLSLLVAVLTCLVVMFCTYMSASFWAQLGSTTTATITFILLGSFLELAKICAGLAVIYAHINKNMVLKICAALVLAIFTSASFVASVGTIAHEIKSGKNLAFDGNNQVQFINSAINTQEQVIASLLLSQQNDIEHGYRARANTTFAQIKHEQDQLAAMHNKLKNIEISNSTVSSVVLIFNALIPLGEDQWEQMITVILGALTEITCLFLLYLNYSLRIVKKSGERISTNKAPMIVEVIDDLPISKDEYLNITKQVITGKVAPTQREVKRVVKLGNENIAKIFSRWVYEGVLIKAGKSYRVAA